MVLRFLYLRFWRPRSHAELCWKVIPDMTFTSFVGDDILHPPYYVGHYPKHRFRDKDKG